MAVWIILTARTFAQDESTSELIVNSLPLTRTEIVIGSYLSSLAFFIYAGLLAIAFHGCVKIVGLLPDKEMHWDLLIPSMLILVGLMMLGLFPFYFKLGYLKAQWVLMIIAFAPFAGLSWLIRSAGADWMAAVTNLADVGVGLAVPVLAALISLSMLISIMLYRRREF
jgi:hypothetical protein